MLPAAPSTHGPVATAREVMAQRGRQLLAPLGPAEPELLRENPQRRGSADSRNRERPKAGGRAMPSAGRPTHQPRTLTAQLQTGGGLVLSKWNMKPQWL